MNENIKNEVTDQTEAEMYHVHDLMDQLAELLRPINLKELESLIVEKFGLNAQFHSCSVSGMDRHQVIQFLVSKGKIVQTEPGYFLLGAHQGCGH